MSILTKLFAKPQVIPPKTKSRDPLNGYTVKIDFNGNDWSYVIRKNGRYIGRNTYICRSQDVCEDMATKDVQERVRKENERVSYIFVPEV